MRRRVVLAAVAVPAAAAMITAALPGSAAVPTAALPGAPLGAVPGTAPVLLRGATDLGPAAQQTEHVTVALASRNQAGLDALLAQPNHPDLTPVQFLDAYAPAPATVAAVRSWALAAGLAATVSPNRTLVSLSGPTAAVDAALGTRTDGFRAADGTTYRSIASPAALPGSFAREVVGVTGLSDLGRLHTATRTGAPAATFPQTFGPKTLASFYDATATATGSGQTVGVIGEGNLKQVQKDLRTFESRFGLPQASVSVTGPGSADTSGQDEYDLDTQYATGEAPGAALRIYDGVSLANTDILHTINSWATEGSVKTASFSAGECEVLAAVTGLTGSLDQVLKQAAAQGQSLFVSSGDNGSFCTAVLGINGIPAGIPDVEYPASSPYAVGVGGTTVVGLGSTGVYTGEVSWYGGGGGVSYVEPKPAFQTSPAPLRRGVPDVALDADPLTGYAVIVSGTQEIIGGTSAGAPAWNGYWARALSARGALGFAGPRLYRARAGFHDVVLGSNGLYPATPGYDYDTGLGTPDVAKLIPAL